MLGGHKGTYVGHIGDDSYLLEIDTFARVVWTGEYEHTWAVQVKFICCGLSELLAPSCFCRLIFCWNSGTTDKEGIVSDARGYDVFLEYMPVEK